MNKSMLLPLFTTVLSSPVLAGGKGGAFYVYKGLAFFLGWFLVCVIFWWTYVWIVQDKRKRKK